MNSKAPLNSIVMAAGKGTRMRSASKHKVCFEIDGIPAINRALKIYNACGIKKHSIVVGAMAEQVMETIAAEFNNVFYAYQKEQVGTANAVRMGIAPLDALPGETDVFVVAGDRIIDQTLLEEFFNIYYASRSDFSLLTVPNIKGSTQGRIVLDEDGNTLGIAEITDIRQRKALAALRSTAEKETPPASAAKIADFLKNAYASDGGTPPKEEKLPVIFGNVWRRFVLEGEPASAESILDAIPISATRFEYSLPGGKVVMKQPSDLENSEFVNNSVYLTKLSALRFALGQLDRNNAQQEEYLSDVVSILASTASKNGKSKFKVTRHNVEDRDLVLGFNDPAELLDVENKIRERSETRNEGKLAACEWFRTIKKWKTAFDT
ncbi:MAG: NTP transferase domain-containing protein [Victivallales bacterium]|nr:NTP transferase domain-containing protein [Victivallales bacterium]